MLNRLVGRVGLVAIVAMLPVFVVAQDEIPEDIISILSQYVGDVTNEGDKTKVDLLINKQEPTSTRRGIIIHFCDTFLNTRDDDIESVQYFDYAGFRYDPRQSLFMYTLCVLEDEVNTDKGYEKRDYKDVFTFSYPEGGEFDMQQLLIDDLLDDEGLVETLYQIRGVQQRSVGQRETCDPSVSMQACNFSSILPVMFKHIMNDFSNIKLATLYGATEGVSEEERAQAIEDFAKSYYGEYPDATSDGMIPCRDPGTHYLSPKMLEGDKKHCSHPQTYKLVDETIKSAHQLLINNDILDGTKIVKLACDDPKMNLYACAFANYGEYFAQSDWRAFQNLYLNEFMYYSLFSDYYINQLRYNVGYAPISTNETSDLSSALRDEAEIMAVELQLSQQAVGQMMRMLNHVSSTYPLHVSLMAYMEDLINYRRTLVNIYTPLNQLFYTWRNAQACQE